MFTVIKGSESVSTKSSFPEKKVSVDNSTKLRAKDLPVPSNHFYAFQKDPLIIIYLQ